MCSDKKLEANRRNAEKSTGPRTVRGKRRSSRNAITIGLFTRHVVLGRESRRTFDAILDALIDEHRPQTLTELHLVERIAESMWRLRRLQRSEKYAHEACRDEIERRQLDNEDYEKHVRDNGLERFTEDMIVKPRPPRVTALEQRVLIQPDSPAATLAVELAKSTKSSAAALSSLYERRLEGTIHRALRELRLLRKERTQSADVPPSPYKRPADADQPNSLSPVLRGEGRGEGQRRVAHKK